MSTYTGKSNELQAIGAFDKFMRAIPAGDHEILLHPGEYFTAGQPDGSSADTPSMWSLKSGWRLRGLGTPDQTKISLHGGMVEGKKWHVIAADYAPANNLLIENITLDCGFKDFPVACNFSGMVVKGSNNTIRAVRVINWGSRVTKSECFGIGLIAAFTDARHNVIEDCDVILPGGVDTIAGWTGFLQSAALPLRTLHPIIRHCRTSNEAGNPDRYANGYTIYNAENGLIEQCRADHVWTGAFMDSAGGEDLIVRDCRFLDVRRGMNVAFTDPACHQGSLVLTGNRVHLIDPNSVGAAFGFEINSLNLNPLGFGLVRIADNYVESNGRKAYLALVRGAHRLIAHDNVFFGDKERIALGGRNNGAVCAWSNFYGDGAPLTYGAEL